MKRLSIVAAMLFACVLAGCSRSVRSVEVGGEVEAAQRAAIASWLRGDGVEAVEHPADVDQRTWEGLPPLTAYLAGEPLSSLASSLWADVGVSLAFPPSFAERPVWVTWEAREAGEALVGLGAQLGLEAVRRGDLELELSEPRASDVRPLVLRSSYESGDTVAGAVQALLSDVGAVQVVGDRILVVDVPSRVERVRDVVDQLAAPRGQWMIEAVFVEVSDTWRESLGLQFGLSGGVSFTLSAADWGLSRAGAVLLELLASASAGSEDARMLASSRVFVYDGGTARSEFGERTPVPFRSVSSEGTVETLRFDTVPTGVILDVALRESSDGRAIVSLAPEISAVTGLVENAAPIVALSRLEVEAVLASGEVLVIGGLELRDSRRTETGVPWAVGPVGRRQDDAGRSRSVVVIVRAERVRAAPMAAGEVE